MTKTYLSLIAGTLCLLISSAKPTYPSPAVIGNKMGYLAMPMFF